MTGGGKLVVDASVVVKWYLPETGSTEASAVLAAGEEKLAPDLLVAEFGNVLWKKVRRGEIEAAEAVEIAQAFASDCPVSLRPASPLLPAAVELATRRQRTVYDSLYLATALAEGCPVLTADASLVQALKGTELESIVRLLGQA